MDITSYLKQLLKLIPIKNKQLMQDELTILWKEIKNNEKNLDVELMKLNDVCKQRKGAFMKFWGKVPKKSEETPAIFQTPMKEDPTTTPQVFREKENASSSSAELKISGTPNIIVI